MQRLSKEWRRARQNTGSGRICSSACWLFELKHSNSYIRRTDAVSRTTHHNGGYFRFSARSMVCTHEIVYGLLPLILVSVSTRFAKCSSAHRRSSLKAVANGLARNGICLSHLKRVERHALPSHTTPISPPPSSRSLHSYLRPNSSETPK
jgi:hypothetical protein